MALVYICWIRCLYMCAQGLVHVKQVVPMTVISSVGSYDRITVIVNSVTNTYACIHTQTCICTVIMGTLQTNVFTSSTRISTGHESSNKGSPQTCAHVHTYILNRLQITYATGRKYAYIHTCILTCIHTYTHTHTQIHIYTCARTDKHDKQTNSNDTIISPHSSQGPDPPLKIRALPSYSWPRIGLLL